MQKEFQLKECKKCFLLSNKYGKHKSEDINEEILIEKY